MENMIKSSLYGSLVLICVSIFTFQSLRSIHSFTSMRALTRRTFEKQSGYPLPAICIQPLDIDIDGHYISLHNLTRIGYKEEGIWRSILPEFNDEQTYDNISASFRDLVEKITVQRDIGYDSDSYEMVALSVEEDFTLERCDYYYHLKCYCINITKQLGSPAIQEIRIHPKKKSEITIVGPGNYYSFERKHTYIGKFFFFKLNFCLSSGVSNM